MSPQFRQDSLKLFVCGRNWIVRTGMLIGLVSSASDLCQALPPQSQPGKQPTYYAQSDFTLPFQVKPGGRCPQHLDLLISRDGGRSWFTHQSAAPTEGRFRFSNIEEGEYWLKVQARDAAGASLSNSTLHLVVDRTKPQASLESDWQGESTLVVTSVVKDPHFDPESLQLQLRTDVASEPQFLPLQVSTDSADSLTGRATIELPACKSFELRLLGTDRAGNRLVVSERYFHPVLANENDALLPALESSDMLIPKDAAPELDLAKHEWSTIELGRPRPLPVTQSSTTHLASVGASGSIVRKPTRFASAPVELVPPEKLEPEEVRETVAVEQATLELEAPQPAPSAQTPTHIVSSSRQFKINYSLTQPVPSGQLNVELWVTLDGGKTWEFWGMDRDAVSPAMVEVEGDGQYGFCVVCVHAEADLRFRPKAGDAPDLMVQVKEPPVVRRLQPAARD